MYSLNLDNEYQPKKPDQSPHSGIYPKAMANLAELVTYGTKRHGKAKTVDNSVSSLTFSTISLVEAITSFLGTDRLKLPPETLRGLINVKLHMHNLLAVGEGDASVVRSWVELRNGVRRTCWHKERRHRLSMATSVRWMTEKGG